MEKIMERIPREGIPGIFSILEDGENLTGRMDIIPLGGDGIYPMEMVELSHWEDGGNIMGRMEVIPETG